MPRIKAYRARCIVPMLAERHSTGKNILDPVKIIDNGVVIVRDGYIERVLSAKNPRLPIGCTIIDMGDVVLLPALVNAHTHLQLSWLKEKTKWGEGFTPWLQSLVSQLSKYTYYDFEDEESDLYQEADLACCLLKIWNTGYVGDFSGSAPGSVTAINKLAELRGLQVVNFCEWFGMKPPFVDDNYPWPPRCREEILKNRELAKKCAPAGHALYSTSAEVMQKTYAWCRAHHKIFSFHLAESDDETELLTSGTGRLYKYYFSQVIPPAWKSPGMRPFAYAKKLGILGPNTLAVHGVNLSSQEISDFAETGASLCLCPRSNDYLGVGQPLVRKLLHKKVRLCLGTDGLSSNEDLNVLYEAYFLRNKYDLPMATLWRMLTINGALALGLKDGAGTMAKGQKARFGVWPL